MFHNILQATLLNPYHKTQEFAEKHTMWWALSPLILVLIGVIGANLPTEPIPADLNNCSSSVWGEGPARSVGTLKIEDAVRTAASQVVPDATNLYDVVKTARQLEEFNHKSTLNSTDYIAVCAALNEPLIATVNGVNVGK